MNKMQDERETQTKFSTWRKKTAIPYICRSIFRQTTTLRIIISFTKTLTPCRPISKKSTITPILGSYPLLNLQDLPFF